MRGAAELTLAQGFLSAGAANVVVTLWRIDDAGAAAFADRFYRALATQDLAQAGATAQRSMASDPHYQSPYYWAGYVLSGEGSGLASAGKAQEVGSSSVSSVSARRERSP